MTDTRARCVCGYVRSYHEAAGHCPLCACGKLPSEHVPVTTPPSPLRAFAFTGPATYPPSPLMVAWPEDQIEAYTHSAPTTEHVCPGKPRSETGNLPRLRRGSFRERPGPAPTADWFGLRVPIIEAPAEVDHSPPPPPLVPARLTVSPDEIAPRALKLGAVAAADGWCVVPWYWRAADRTDASVLVMRRGELRAVAYWKRAPGAAWKTGGGQAWRIGDWPRRASIAAIAKIVAEPEA
jgi:hypothetical protein